MKRARSIALISIVAASGCAFAIACSGDSNDTDGGTDASNDTTQPDANKPDANKTDGGTDSSTTDSSATDASDSGCPGSWLDLPDVTLLEPDGGLPPLLLHFAGVGTQNYTCEPDGGGGFAWTFVGPEANLNDCVATLAGHHFASEAGAAAPEWQTLDNSDVIGKKIIAYTPDGGAGSIPWLLVQETSVSGTGTISKTLYVQRLNTDGGNAPSTTCDGNDLDATTKVPYAADYYFYGQ